MKKRKIHDVQDNLIQIRAAYEAGRIDYQETLDALTMYFCGNEVAAFEKLDEWEDEIAAVYNVGE